MPGRAEAALEAVVLGERAAARGAACRPGWPATRPCVTVGAVELRGEHQARAGGLAVDQHGARAADALLAAGVGAGEGQLVAQEVEQQRARLDEHVVRRCR